MGVGPLPVASLLFKPVSGCIIAGGGFGLADGFGCIGLADGFGFAGILLPLGLGGDLVLPLTLTGSSPIVTSAFGGLGGGSDFAALLDLEAILYSCGFRVPTVLAMIGVPAPPGGGGGWWLPPVVTTGSAGGGAGFGPSMSCVICVGL